MKMYFTKRNNSTNQTNKIAKLWIKVRNMDPKLCIYRYFRYVQLNKGHVRIIDRDLLGHIHLV